MPDVFVWTGRFSGGVMGFSGRIHNLVYGYCVPCHTILLLYSIKHLSLSYDDLQPALYNILMDTKEMWASPFTMCVYVAALGSHGRYKFPVCVYFSVLPCSRCITRGPVAGLIFLSGYPGRIKLPVAPAYAMAWLLSIFILDVLNRVSCFVYYIHSIEELSVIGSIRAVILSLHFLWIIVLYSSSSSSSYEVL